MNGDRLAQNVLRQAEEEEFDCSTFEAPSSNVPITHSLYMNIEIHAKYVGDAH
jgi:hypothetical protein